MHRPRRYEASIWAVGLLWSLSACYGIATRDHQFAGRDSVSAGSSESSSVLDSAPAGDDDTDDQSTPSTTTGEDSVTGTTGVDTTAETDDAETGDDCEAPKIMCDGRCLDPQTDAIRCGVGPDCQGGMTCDLDDICVDGICVCAPACDGLQCGLDPNCGESCGECQGDNACVDGQCMCEAQCDGRECGKDGCAGDCGTCADDESCSAEGQCECPAGTQSCADSCVDTDTDVQHCGDCEDACEDRDHSSPTCEDGACGIACDDTWLDCDGRQRNGCEASAEDPDSCGDCSTQCEAGEHAEATCDAGECGFACDEGWGDCDDDAANGCETDLTTLTDCGACGMACEEPAEKVEVSCVASGGSAECVYECETGFGDCNGDLSDGCEVDTNASNQHCGRCDNACDAGDICSDGDCECDPMCGDRECGDDPGECSGVNCGTCDDGFSCDGDGMCVADD